MAFTKNLGLELHDAETGQAILDIVDSNLSIIESDLNVIDEFPSGLAEGTKPGRVVALSADGRLYLAYDDAPSGQENRMNVIGVTLDTAPAVGENLRVLTFGVGTFDSADSIWSRLNPNVPTTPGAPGDAAFPSKDPVYGKVAYLKAGDTSDDTTQGFLTSSTDVGESPNSIVVGLFFPNQLLLVMPVYR